MEKEQKLFEDILSNETDELKEKKLDQATNFTQTNISDSKSVDKESKTTKLNS